jgi:hypothetical protein
MEEGNTEDHGTVMVVSSKATTQLGDLFGGGEDPRE